MRAWRRFALALTVGAASSCGDTAGEGGLEAVYSLVELGGQPVPYNPPGGCCTYLSGSLTLLGGTYTVSLTEQDKTSTMITIINEQGSYSVNGTAVAFQRSGGGTFNFNLFNGLLNGRTIRLQLGGTSPGATDQFAAAFRR